MPFVILGTILFLAAAVAIWVIVRQPPKSPSQPIITQELSEIENRIRREVQTELAQDRAATWSGWSMTTVTTTPVTPPRTAPAPEPSVEPAEKDSTIFDFLLEDEQNNQS